jgi:putative ABC transport system substrate-binding protein
MHDLGYDDGRSVHLKWRFWEGRVERIPELVAELLRASPDVVLCSTALPTRVAMEMTKTIPLVFVGVGSDPVLLGLVSQLARPGGNVTGVTHMANTLGNRQIQLISEAIPQVRRVAILTSPNYPYPEVVPEI